jgi:hypothetical protein
MSLPVFGASLLLSYAAVDLVIEEGEFLRHFQQTWASHFGGSKSFEYGSAQDFPFDWSVLLRNWDLTLPAAFGVVVLARRVRRSATSALPVMWLALAIAVFISHRPWWPYYYVHIAIPLCWCAAVGMCAVIEVVKARRRLVWLGLAVVYAISALAWMGARVYLEASGIRRSPQTYSSPVLGQVARYKPYCEWLFADRPIYSFHTGIASLPDLAVLPVKRFWASEMSNQRLTDELVALKPGLILLENDTRERPFQKLLQTEYRLVYVDADNRLYAHGSIAKKAPFWSRVSAVN